MEEKDLLVAIGKIGTTLDAKLGTINEIVEKGDKVAAKLKDEVAGLVEKNNSLQGQIDEMSTKMNKDKFSGVDVAKSIKDVISDTLVKSTDFANYIKGGSQGIILSIKASTVVTPSQSVQPDYAPGFFYNPARPIHAREFLASGHTESNVVYYIQEQSFTQAAAIVAEAAQKPQSDFTLVSKFTNVQKLATYHVISTEMLQDVTGLSGYLSTRLPNKLRYTEDAEILYGSGATGHLLGLSPGGTAYVTTSNYIGANANYMDVIVCAMLQARQQEYVANVILLNPADVDKMIITKNSQGTYLTPNVFSGAQFMINGVPVIANTAVPVGSFLVGDFANAAFLWDRQDLAMRFYEQDGTNVQKGLITIELSERVALAVFRPSAMITGTFAAALLIPSGATTV